MRKCKSSRLFRKLLPLIASLWSPFILQGTARVPATGEEIPNPWEKQSLYGIACIMHDRFHKRSFVTFNNHLLDGMGFHLSEAGTKSSPLKAVAEVQKMMYTWETRDLWAHMSPDFFSPQYCSAISIHSLLSASRCFWRLRSSYVSSRQPLHQSLVPLTSILSSRSLQPTSRTYTTAAPPLWVIPIRISLRTPTPPQNPGANNGGGGQYKPGGLEFAAAASTTTPAPPVSSPPASTAPTNSGPNPYQHEGKTIYTRAIRALPGPVLHTANIYFSTQCKRQPQTLPRRSNCPWHLQQLLPCQRFCHSCPL